MMFLSAINADCSLPIIESITGFNLYAKVLEIIFVIHPIRLIGLYSERLSGSFFLRHESYERIVATRIDVFVIGEELDSLNDVGADNVPKLF